jgi:hypothetical protein
MSKRFGYYENIAHISVILWGYDLALYARRDGGPLVTGSRCCGTELIKLHYCISRHTCSIKERGKQ